MANPTQVEDTKRRKDNSFLGTFGIRFNDLDFSESDEAILGGEDPDWELVNKLKKTIRSAYSWSPGRIPALIDRRKLQEALQRSEVNSNITEQSDRRYTELNLGADVRIKCLRGWHEYLAANAVLAEEHKCWDISLYSSDVDEATKTQLIDELLYQREIIDAEFFYRCSLHWRNHWHDLEPPQDIWLNILNHKSKDAAKQIKRLLSERNPFTKVLETFHEMPALFWGFKLGQVGKMNSLLCRPVSLNDISLCAIADLQELLSYLLRIKAYWSQLCGGDLHGMRSFDVETIKKCSGKAPGSNAKHKEHLENLFRSRKILRRFNDQDRDRIWKQLEDTTKDRSVPTLETFFGNLEYLRLATGCLRFLFDINESSPQNRHVSLSREILEDQVTLRKFCDKSGNSLRQELEDCFQRGVGDNCLLQVSEDHYKLLRNQVVDPFELAYRQLLLFAFREFPSMPWQTRQKLAGATSTVNLAVLFKFATLAHRIGFRSKKIEAIRGQGPGDVSQERPHRVRSTDEPTLYGKPKPNDLTRYKQLVMIPNMHQPLNEQVLSTSYFFVQRSLYLDLMHIFPLHGIESLLESSVAEGELRLFEGVPQPSKHNNDVEGFQRKWLELQELASQLSDKQDRQTVERRVPAAIKNSIARGVEAEPVSLEGRKRRLEAEIRQLSQQAERLRALRQETPRADRLGALSELREAQPEDDHDFTRQEDQLSQYDDASFESRSCYSPAQLEPDHDEGRITVHLQTRNGSGGYEHERIRTTKNELQVYMASQQRAGYKLFDRDNKILTPYTCFDAVEKEAYPTLVLVSESQAGVLGEPFKRQRTEA
ncbi:hypothetical protein FDECE_17227 [Fusarium decemcellulare]|nr:hypothetical protein FDECE_17227 [Fusarium decemcellulare]